MKNPVVVKKKDIKMSPIPFGGKEGDAGMWSLDINPPEVDTKGLFFGTSEINPGYAAHRWHSHTVDVIPDAGMEIIYHKDFEEIYYITGGRGVAQWETDEGKVEEIEVGAGDIVFFPRGVARHQVLNTGTEKLTLFWGGGPLCQILKK